MLCHSEATQPWGENVSSQRVPYQCFNCFLSATTQECWFRTCQNICYRATTVRVRCGLIFCSFNFQDKHWKLGLHIVSFIYDWLSVTYFFFAYSNSQIYVIMVNVSAHVCLQKTLLEIVGYACWVFMLKKQWWCHDDFYWFQCHFQLPYLLPAVCVAGLDILQRACHWMPIPLMQECSYMQLHLGI